MRTTTCLLLLLIAAPVFGQQTYDLLIKNGKIVDGTGNPWYHGNVAIANGKIVAIGKAVQGTATRVIDANSLIVAPGFIDVHTHIEDDEKRNPTADNFIYDGVTTVVTGNCGLSKTNLGQYFQLIDSIHLSINVASLIGHNDVRKAVMGSIQRDPTPQEQQQMEALIEQAMKDGAIGLSTGLIYIPGTYSKTTEVMELAKTAAHYGGLYATHLRDESDDIVAAIHEALQIGRETGMPVEISHFKCSGQQNWGRAKEILGLVEAARKEGIDVTIDQYPYTASSTNLHSVVPSWALSGGNDSIQLRFHDPVLHAKIKSEMLRNLKKRHLKHYDYAVVAYYGADTTLNGKSLATINQLMGRKSKAKYEVETILEMVEKGGAAMVFHGMSEADVKHIMQYPFNMFACDASIRVFGSGVPHPRGYGTNAKVLSKYVREEKALRLEEAIRRMTSLPAQKFGFKDRGLLLPGYAADVVIFDENNVQDRATYENPHQYPVGFQYVLVNGKLTLDQGKHTGLRNGKVLYGPAKQTER